MCHRLSTGRCRSRWRGGRPQGYIRAHRRDDGLWRSDAIDDRRHWRHPGGRMVAGCAGECRWRIAGADRGRLRAGRRIPGLQYQPPHPPRRRPSDLASRRPFLVSHPDGQGPGVLSRRPACGHATVRLRSREARGRAGGGSRKPAGSVRPALQRLRFQRRRGHDRVCRRFDAVSVRPARLRLRASRAGGRPRRSRSLGDRRKSDRPMGDAPFLYAISTCGPAI